jgi:hypothetical protein
MKITDEKIGELRGVLPVSTILHLNWHLIEDRKIGIEEVGKIYQAHGKKFFILRKAYSILQKIIKKKKISKKTRLKMLDIEDQLRMQEYNAQEAWGFPRDENYHYWWTELPGCTCPQVDNRDMLGAKYRVHAEDCIWHGDLFLLKHEKKG